MKYIVEVKYTNPAHEHVSLRRRVDTINRVVEARNEDEAINRVANQQRALGFLVREAKVIQPDVLTEEINDDWFKEGSFKTQKNSDPIKHKIATEHGVTQTLEGPVDHAPGHHIMTGPKGENWPLSPQNFKEKYIDNKDGTATPKPVPKTAKLADHDGVINASWGKLQYKKGEHYIVRHGEGDYGPVAKDIFHKTYDTSNLKEEYSDRLRSSGETYSVPKNSLPNFSTPNRQTTPNRQNRKVTFGDVGGASNLPQNLPSEKDGTANILPYDPNKHKKDKKPKLAEGIGSLFSRKTGTKPTTPTYRGLPQSGKVVTPDGKHVGTIFPYQTRTQGPQFSFSDTHRETLKNDHGLSHDEISNQERDHHVIGKLNSGEWKIKKEEVEQIDELNYEYDMKRLPPKGFTVPHQQNPHLHYNPKTKEVHNTRTGTTYPDYGNEFVGYRMHMAREEVEEIDESKPFPSFVTRGQRKFDDQTRRQRELERARNAQAGTLAAKKAAAKLKEETEVQYIEEKLTVADPVSAWIKDFVNSDNPKFKGKSKKERIRMALGAYYAAQRDAQQETNEESEKKYNEKEVKHAEKKQDKKKGSLHKIKMEPEMEVTTQGAK